MYFKAPSAAPKIRLTKPKCTISITRVKAEASNRKTSGTSNHIRIKATTWAKVSDVPNSSASFSPTEANNARATSNPTTKPTIEANCLINPFVNPSIAPMLIIATIIQSRTVILYIVIKKEMSC